MIDTSKRRIPLQSEETITESLDRVGVTHNIEQLSAKAYYLRSLQYTYSMPTSIQHYSVDI